MKKLNDVVLERLHTQYPTKKFHYIIEIDPVSFSNRCTLTCDGKKTPFGYDDETITRLIETRKYTLDEMVNSVANQVIYAIDGDLIAL